MATINIKVNSSAAYSGACATTLMIFPRDNRKEQYYGY